MYSNMYKDLSEEKKFRKSTLKQEISEAGVGAKNVKVIMSQIKNTGYLRHIDLDGLSEDTLSNLSSWLQQVKNEISDFQRKSKQFGRF